jgi:hypothetical protein
VVDARTPAVCSVRDAVPRSRTSSAGAWRALWRGSSRCRSPAGRSTSCRDSHDPTGEALALSERDLDPAAGRSSSPTLGARDELRRLATPGRCPTPVRAASAPPCPRARGRAAEHHSTARAAAAARSAWTPRAGSSCDPGTVVIVGSFAHHRDDLLESAGRPDSADPCCAADDRRDSPAAWQVSDADRRHRARQKRSWDPPPNRTADRARCLTSARASHRPITRRDRTLASPRAKRAPARRGCRRSRLGHSGSHGGPAPRACVPQRAAPALLGGRRHG